MAIERTVACPKCGAERTTKASENQRIGCSGCGVKFLAPAPPEPAPATAPPAEPKPDDSKPAAPKAGSVKVVRATGVKVKKTARPRKATKPAGQPSAAPDGVPAPKGTSEPVPPAPPNQERSKSAGRRGGVGYYRKRFSRAS